ncbi:NAD kinase [Derxia lacustris]|uniref:NAD kinase n=1 Tax=Derxia lacustris TaxID=764842 RepID=UPI000A177032|nr:NAD kinase [Derxia lacustris]
MPKKPAPKTAPAADSAPSATRPPAGASSGFRTAALIGKYGGACIAEPIVALAAFLRRRGLNVLFDPDTGATLKAPAHEIADIAQLARQIDLAIVIGGDGTMLGIARQVAREGVPVVGVNHGRLGFMTDIPLATTFDAIGAILDGNFKSENRLMLEARVQRRSSARAKPQVLFEAVALNDVVIARGAISGMVEVSVSVDGVHAYTQRADGLIVATPTGSTAYSLSAHGPILHPELAGLVLVPIAPQALSNRPIVLPEHVEIAVTLDRATPLAHDTLLVNPASASFDMQTFTELREGDEIVIRRSPHRVTFLHPPGYNYFGVLREKLHWTRMPTGGAARKSPRRKAVTT